MDIDTAKKYGVGVALGGWGLDAVSSLLCLSLGGGRVTENNPLWVTLGLGMFLVTLAWLVVPLGILLICNMAVLRLNPWWGINPKYAALIGGIIILTSVNLYYAAFGNLRVLSTLIGGAM